MWVNVAEAGGNGAAHCTGGTMVGCVGGPLWYVIIRSACTSLACLSCFNLYSNLLIRRCAAVSSFMPQHY